MKTFSKEQMTSLKINVRAYYDYQSERLAMDGRLGQKKSGELKKDAPPRDPKLLIYLQSRRDEVIKIEKELEKDIKNIVKDHPLYQIFLKNVKGCGVIMAAVIITEFDITKAPAVSNLWSFAGLAPGKDKKKKGMKCPYNQFLRAKLCGVLGGGFLKAKNEYYTKFYYQEKMRLENSDNEVMEIKKKGTKPVPVKWRDATPGHRHNAATRKMVKEFLKDLYVAWREIEGLPVREPYEVEYLGRQHSQVA